MTLERIQRHKHGVLLLALLAVFLVESFPHRLLLGPVASDVLITAVLFLVFLVVFERRRNRLIALVAIITALGVDWARHVASLSTYETALALVYHAALLLMSGFATFVILRNIFQQRVVAADDVLGAACGYLLAAGAWSNLYSFTEILNPGSFSMGGLLDGQYSAWHWRLAVFNYVSLGTLTSVGSGVVSPVLPPATAFVPLESLFGQFYIAVVVAQLVGPHLRRSESAEDR
ncbi:MAG: hypothetical protein WCA12_03700 [Burkholderiales bacterium]